MILLGSIADRNIFIKDWQKGACLWFGFFLLTLFIILMVQLVLLPHFFPSWHAGSGLLVGGDSVKFHREAVEMSEKINSEGWSAWELRPRGWMPAGVAGAIYALSWPEPWVLAPLNAAVHAATIILVMKLIMLFIPSWKIAIIAALPFGFFPSAMLWYTQIHRDGYQILGIMLFLYGFLIIANRSLREISYLKEVLKGFLLSGAGIVLVWLARPHILAILQYTGILLLLLVIPVILFKAWKLKSSWKEAFSRVLILVLIVILITPLSRSDVARKYQVDFSAQAANELLIASNSKDSFKILYLAAQATQQEQEQIAHNNGFEATFPWENTSWLPQPIENNLYSIALLRSVHFAVAYGETASGIDTDVSFHSAYDFLFYLPRALQISFLAPFPSEWFSEGSEVTSGFFRSVSALEMFIVYLVLPFLLCGIWTWRKRLEMWVILFFCTIMMLPIIYSTPNVGTLYRYRYGYLMLLVALGLAAFFKYLGVRKAGAAKRQDERLQSEL